MLQLMAVHCGICMLAARSSSAVTMKAPSYCGPWKMKVRRARNLWWRNVSPSLEWGPYYL